ncbi:MAG: ABC transporter substrate-binding protein, partial [Halothermotrichaceae bacterium]
MKLNKNLVISMMIIGLLIMGISVSAEEVTVEDYDNFKVNIDTPVNTIVCLSTSANQVLMALNSFNKVIAWDKNSDEGIFPEPEREIKVAAKSSHSPQIEAIAELDPDLVIADTMLQDDHRQKIESFEIPVIVERLSDSERVFTTIRNIGKVLEKEERAEKLITFISEYREMIEERTQKANLSKDEKTKVYWEWNKPFKTGSSGASVHPKIVQAGGINIC